MYEQPYNPYATNLAVVKEYFQKPKVLAMGILQILSILVMIVMAIVSSASVSEAISRAPEMDRFISYGGGSVLSAATIVPIIISAIPILVTALGYILLYTGSRSESGRPTAGATTLFVMAIITLCLTGFGVLMALLCLLVSSSLFSWGLPFGKFSYGETTLYVIFAIFVVLIVLYEVLYCVHKVRFFNSVRKSATSVELSCKGATGFGVMSVINAVLIGLMLLIYTFAFFAATAASQYSYELQYFGSGLIAVFGITLGAVLIGFIRSILEASIALGYKRHILAYTSTYNTPYGAAPGNGYAAAPYVPYQQPVQPNYQQPPYQPYQPENRFEPQNQEPRFEPQQPVDMDQNPYGDSFGPTEIPTAPVAPFVPAESFDDLTSPEPLADAPVIDEPAPAPVEDAQSWDDLIAKPEPVAEPEPVAQPVAEPVQEAPAAPAFCTNCGAPVQPDAMFCSNCGHKLR